MTKAQQLQLFLLFRAAKMYPEVDFLPAFQPLALSVQESTPVSDAEIVQFIRAGIDGLTQEVLGTQVTH